MNRYHRSGGRGFSLLEMVIALFIVTLLFGMAVAATRHFFGDEELRGSAQKLALYAKTARQEALKENRPYEIVVEVDRLILRPAADETSDSPRLNPDGTIMEETEPEEYLFPEKVTLKMKSWGSQDWEKPQQSVWYFTASGLCAPNSFRLERGDSWMQMTFNPLTANRQEEEWYLP